MRENDGWIILIVIGGTTLAFILPWWGWLILVLLFIVWMEFENEVNGLFEWVRGKKKKGKRG